jgi:NAD-dependent dihydropyrimidine dehydrogenase PreA subunit
MRKARQKILDEIRRIKTETACFDCLEFHPYYVMQFDHVKGEKVDKINRMVYTSSYKKVMEEVAKCHVVCANCHHKRTFWRDRLSRLMYRSGNEVI